MNYDEMSDFEINKLVAKALGVHWHLSPSGSGTDQWVYSDHYEECDTLKCAAIDLPDYCNNPSDAWPIIVESGIDIEWPDENLGGVGQASKYVVGDTDPICEFTEKSKALRAAMIVFLMMQEGESGS